MSSNPIEVLRRIVELARRHEGHDPQLREALASLSALKPPPMNDNAVAVNESAPVNDKPESAEVVAWAVVGNKSGDVLNVFHGPAEKMRADSTYWPEHGFHVRPLVYGDTAPPRPEASEGEVVAHGFYDPVTGAYDETQRTPRWLPAVVCTAPQQASAPVGVEDECQLHREAHLRIDSILIGAGVFEVEHEGGTRETWENTIAAVQTLAQHPAAVDEALERLRREGYPRLWNADLVGGQISVERMREILTAALAGQQGGES